jgi:hypothetical protein
LLASGRNSNLFCWQAAATAISIAGKLPQQQICFAGKLPQKLFSQQVVLYPTA